MLDKVEYWLNLAKEDISVAKVLLNGAKYLQAGFFCHLIAEKALKAVVASITSEIPPKTHDLIKLAKRGDIYDCLTDEQISLLDDLTPLQIEARYPEYKEQIIKALNLEECVRLLKETEEFLCWIKKKLDK